MHAAMLSRRDTTVRKTTLTDETAAPAPTTGPDADNPVNTAETEEILDSTGQPWPLYHPNVGPFETD